MEGVLFALLGRFAVITTVDLSSQSFELLRSTIIMNISVLLIHQSLSPLLATVIVTGHHENSIFDHHGFGDHGTSTSIDHFHIRFTI